MLDSAEEAVEASDDEVSEAESEPASRLTVSRLGAFEGYESSFEGYESSFVVSDGRDVDGSDVECVAASPAPREVRRRRRVAHVIFSDDESD